MYLINEESLKNTTYNKSEIFLKNLVEIDSQISNHKGITRIQYILADRLIDLGFKIKFIENPLINTPPLLHAEIVRLENATTVSFIGHSDVVTTLNKNKFRVKDNKIFGSGVADDKGGLVVCIKAIEDFIEEIDSTRININIIVSPNEETGSIGFHDFFKKIGERSDYVLGLEPALHTGSLITSRNGNRWYKFNIQGISAHAGRFGRPHINAAHKLALIIAKMHELNDEDKLRRVNVGSFQGGNDGFNTICGSATAKIDVRFSNFECRNYLHKKIEEFLRTTNVSCPYTKKESLALYSIEDDCPPLAPSNTDTPWYGTLLENISNLEERSIEGSHAGGAADINYFSAPGRNVIDGLGPVGGGLHTNNEYIERSTLITRAKAIQLFLVQLHNKSTQGRINVH